MSFITMAKIAKLRTREIKVGIRYICTRCLSHFSFFGVRLFFTVTSSVHFKL